MEDASSSWLCFEASWVPHQLGNIVLFSPSAIVARVFMKKALMTQVHLPPPCKGLNPLCLDVASTLDVSACLGLRILKTFGA